MNRKKILSRRSFYLVALVAVTLAGAAAFVACTKKTNNTTACKVDDDCPAGDLCTNSVCTKASCSCPSARQECVPQTGECIELGCRTNADCSSGQNCIASVCQTPVTTAASCEVLNTGRYVSQGGSLTIQAEGFDASNAPVPYLTISAISVDKTDVFSTDGTSTITAGTTAGTASVTATIGGVPCSAVFTNIGATPAASVIRISAYESGTDGAPISGLAPTASADLSLLRVYGPDAVLVSDAFTEDSTTAGLYTATLTGTPPSTLVVQFAGTLDFAPLTIYGLPSNDLVLPLSRISGVAGFGGKPDFSGYKQHPPITSGQVISAAVVGASLPPSILLSFNLGLFTGDLGLEPPVKSGQSSVQLTDYIGWLTGANACVIAQNSLTATKVTGQLPIPRYIYLDYNQGTPSDKGPNCDGFAARGLPGHRVAWSLGAQLDFVNLSSAIFPIFQAGTSNVTVGTILPLVVPLLSSFASGANALPHDLLAEKDSLSWNAFAIPSAPGTQSSDTDFASVNVTPTLPLGNVALFQDPGLAPDPASPANAKFDTVATIIAAQSPAFGIVPLGLGFGTDADGDGKLDSLNAKDLTDYPVDTVFTRYSSPGAPVSDGSIIAIAASLNLKDLSAKTGQISPAFRLQLNVSRKAGALGWTDTSSPTLPSMTDASLNAPFITMANDSAYTVDTSHEQDATGGYDILQLPVMGTSGDATQDGMVYVNVTGGQTTSGVTSYGIVVSPALFTGSTTLSIPIAVGYLPSTNLPALTVTAVSLKFDNKNGISALNANGGLDFEQLAGSINAAAVWSHNVPLSTVGAR